MDSVTALETPVKTKVSLVKWLNDYDRLKKWAVVIPDKTGKRFLWGAPANDVQELKEHVVSAIESHKENVRIVNAEERREYEVEIKGGEVFLF